MFECHVCNRDLKYQTILRYKDQSHCSTVCVSSYVECIKRNKLNNTVATKKTTDSYVVKYVKSVLNCFSIDNKEKKI